MPVKGAKLRTSSSIDELPTEAREKLEGMMFDMTNGIGYRDMARIMTEDGYPLSKSAIAAYARKKLLYLKRMQAVQEQTRIMMAYLEEHPSTDLARQINALIQNGLMWRIIDGADDISEMKIEDAIKYSLEAQRAAVYEYRYRDSQVERVPLDGEEEERRVAWLREKLKDNPELLGCFERALAAPEKNAEGENV
jgi:hypothetical protein